MRMEAHVFSDSPYIYRRMARALENSVKANSPKTHIDIVEITASDQDLWHIGRGGLSTFTHNTRKARHHHRSLEKASDGELICFIDCDTFVLQDLSGIDEFDQFDLGITYRPANNKYKFNSGVVFVRASDSTRELYHRWAEEAKYMLGHRDYFSAYHSSYGGINQSALGSLMERGYTAHLNVFNMQTRYWNALSDEHPRALEEAKIVHLVGPLRRHIAAKMYPRGGQLGPLVREWRKYDGEHKEIRI